MQPPFQHNNAHQQSFDRFNQHVRQTAQDGIKHNQRILDDWREKQRREALWADMHSNRATAQPQQPATLSFQPFITTTHPILASIAFMVGLLITFVVGVAAGVFVYQQLHSRPVTWIVAGIIWLALITVTVRITRAVWRG